MQYSEFLLYAKHFLEISNQINDGWTLNYYKDNVYLVKSVIQCLEKGEDKIDEEESNELKCCNLDPISDNQSVCDSSKNFRKWEYHILHSLTYQVPVIYFNVWSSSGQLLTLDELWKAVDSNFKESVFKNKWFTLTQQEHPYLFKPFFYFHPCHTEDLLKCFPNPKINVLITWLSSVGQVIWLNLNPIYGKNVFLER